MTEDLVLSLQGVNSGYRSSGLLRKGGYHRVLHDINFEIRHGEILGLVGESGSGKSTLARTILGLLEQKGDEIFSQADAIVVEIDIDTESLQLPEPRLQCGVDSGGASENLRQVRCCGAQAPGTGDVGAGGTAGGDSDGEAR